MKTKAAVQPAFGETFVLDELDVPDPGPGQALVRLISTGVCHSQIHQMHNPNLPRPWLLGHEATGVVTGVGKGVTHLKEGDHAIVTWVHRAPFRGRKPLEPVGVRYRGELAHGIVYAWAEDVLADADLVVRIPKDAPTDVTCIIGCPVLTGAGAVMHTVKARSGESVAVFGAGGVGLCALQTAALLQAYPVIAVDLADEKLEFAKEFGATHTINASKADPVEAIADITSGGADYVFDAVGAKTTMEQILPATRSGGPGADNHGGIAVLIGMPATEITIDPAHFMFNQRQYRGSLGATYPDSDFQMFLRWYQEGKFPLDKLVTRRYRFDQLHEACEALERGEILGRAIIEF